MALRGLAQNITIYTLSIRVVSLHVAITWEGWSGVARGRMPGRRELDARRGVVRVESVQAKAGLSVYYYISVRSARAASRFRPRPARARGRST